MSRAATCHAGGTPQCQACLTAQVRASRDTNLLCGLSLMSMSVMTFSTPTTHTHIHPPNALRRGEVHISHSGPSLFTLPVAILIYFDQNSLFLGGSADASEV